MNVLRMYVITSIIFYSFSFSAVTRRPSIPSCDRSLQA